ncbi:MAG: helix-turn-helix domain-containing protein [Planctomycetia bacterium]|jgi:plasmid maintenance system antidote protein VapI
MPRKPKPIDAALKAAITRSGLTHYALAKAAGLSPAQLDRFVSGRRDLRLETASRLAVALGLELATVS